YSLMPSPVTAHRARLAVKRLDEGPGSSALHAASIGTELSFGGPWGKLGKEGGLDEATLVVATDTGITAALGLVERDPKNVREVAWLRTDDETFLELDHVRARIEARAVRLVTITIPAISSADRVDFAHRAIEARVRECDARIILA